MIPERSEASRSARSVFFEDYNDIDIYVEDTAVGYEKIFVEILSRIFLGRFRVAKIFPLGARPKVIEHCNMMGDASTRPHLHIVDGDLFLLCGESLNNAPGLYKLPFYCIENLLIDMNAIHALLNEEEIIKLRSQIEREFDYSGWLGNNEAMLFDLFVEYAVSFKLNPKQQTVAYPVSNLVSSNNGHIDPLKLSQRIIDLREKSIGQAGEENYERLRDEIIVNAEATRKNKRSFVSGKDYLLPLLKIRFRSLVKTKISDNNIKLRLATKCNVDDISDIHNSVFIPT